MPGRGAGAGGPRTGGRPLRWSATPKLWAYIALGALGLAAGVASGRPEALVLAAPFLVLAAVGVVASPAAALDVEQRLDVERITEQEPAHVEVVVRGPLGATLDVRVEVPPGVATPGGVMWRLPLGGAGTSATASIPIVPVRWGSFRLGGAHLRLVGPFGMLAVERRLRPGLSLRAYPPPEALARLVQPSETALVSGMHVSRARGPGLEFAELRPYRPGDRVREVNWRATARRGSLFVNERHPERSVDVVILVDAFADEELGRAVVAADALVRAYLGRRDRVGLVVFGGALRWIRPGTGLRQQYLVLDALLDSRVFASEVWRDLRAIPPRILPAKALVVALSPLLDARAIAAVADLDDRGIEVAVLAVAPSARTTSSGQEGALVDRLRVLAWDTTVEDLRGRGVPVAVWSTSPVGEAVDELARWPRQRVRAR